MTWWTNHKTKQIQTGYVDKGTPDKLVDNHGVATLIDGIADSLSWGTSFLRFFFSSVRISDAFSLGKVRRCTCSDTWRLSDSPDLNGNPRTKWSFLAGKIIHNYCGFSMRRGENQWKSSNRPFYWRIFPIFSPVICQFDPICRGFPSQFWSPEGTWKIQLRLWSQWCHAPQGPVVSCGFSVTWPGWGDLIWSDDLSG